jgi:glycosyltransferase involved in cell wall biosynthesis
VLGVHYLEETYNEGYGGSRFLLEMDVQLQNGTVRTSEYVYLPKDGSKLCHTTNFQWDQNVHVTLLITMKNVGQWVDHLIYNLEDIYHETKDENFELIVVDFNSTDKDIEGALKKSSLPKWKYIPFKGKFHKTLALQTGIDFVKDDNSIIMTLDMHLTLPPNFIDSIRKHTIQGKMIYVPMVFRLDDGHTADNVNGFWEIYGFGLFSMYKSDWIAVGGWDTVKFKHKWGGEDTDMFRRSIRHKHMYDVSRHRYPGLFHFFHTHHGQWGKELKSNNC